MHPEVEQCMAIVSEIRPEDASAISAKTMEQLLRRLYEDDQNLTEMVKARSGEFNPRAPIYLAVQEIVTCACVIYAAYDILSKTYDVFSKTNKLIDVLVDRETQIKIVEEAVNKLRKLGLSFPAQKLENILHAVLDHWTKPPQ